MSDYWNGKRVLCIGGAGFLGSHLIPLLVEVGAHITVMDNLSRGTNKILQPGFTWGDCSNEGSCRDLFKEKDVIFNLAAEVAGVQFNQSHNGFMFSRNVLYQMMPLKVAAEYKIERFLAVSSVCVYGKGHSAPCKEENGYKDLPVPANVGYAMAKRMGEMMAVWTAEETGLHTVVVRPSNLFGERDYFDERAHVIPALMRKVADPETDVVVANGTGFEEREFLYAGDAARGMMAAVEHGRKGEVYNLGTNGETCVRIGDLLELILDVADSDKQFRFERQFDPGDDVRWSDAGKANGELGWTHTTGLEDGLRKMWGWYKLEMKKDVWR